MLIKINETAYTFVEKIVTFIVEDGLRINRMHLKFCRRCCITDTYDPQYACLEDIYIVKE